MSKRRANSTLTQQRAQLDLPISGNGILNGTLDCAAFRVAIMIRRGKYSRDELCELISRRLGRAISVSQLNAWTAPTNANRLPADILVAICDIYSDWSPLDELLAPVGRCVAGRIDRAYAEIGRVAHERQLLDERESAAWRLVKEGGR